MVQLVLGFVHDLSADTIEWLIRHANQFHQRMCQYLGFILIALAIGAACAATGHQYVNTAIGLGLMVIIMVVGSMPFPLMSVSGLGAAEGKLMNSEIRQGVAKFTKGYFQLLLWIILSDLLAFTLLSTPLLDWRQHPGGIMFVLMSSIGMFLVAYLTKWRGNAFRNVAFSFFLIHFLIGIVVNANRGKSAVEIAGTSLNSTINGLVDNNRANNVRFIEKYYREHNYLRPDMVDTMVLYRITVPQQWLFTHTPNYASTRELTLGQITKLESFQPSARFCQCPWHQMIRAKYPAITQQSVQCSTATGNTNRGRGALDDVKDSFRRCLFEKW